MSETIDPVIWRADLAKRMCRSSVTVSKWIVKGCLPKPDVHVTKASYGWKLSTLNKAGVFVPGGMPDSKPPPVAKKRFMPPAPPPDPEPMPYGSDGHHLYRHYDQHGRLLYVGISISALERLSDHFCVSHWSKNIARVELTIYKDRHDVRIAERLAIQRENPLHNITHAKKVSP